MSTPIGNLGDITIRGLEILASADLIACEDTRVTGKLLSHFGIKAKMHSYHEYNADKEGAIIIERLKKGEVVALASDAGTPLVSDPGQRLVALARENDLPVFPVPGASAPLAAITASGFSTQRFTFFGFLPPKQVARQSELKKLLDEKGTLAFFEGPSRLAACLSDMALVLGEDRQGAVCRELTKMHEEVQRDSLANLASYYEQYPPRGEIVIVLAPKDEEQTLDIDALLLELLQTMSVSRAASEAAKLTGRAKRDLYQKALFLKEQSQIG
ncbi:MAG: 16S rRNA (cytidine(1402)-2'-O)-methyltransferase [Nitratireductor sp.]